MGRGNTRWRVYVSGLLWPHYPGYSGGEIRDYHLLKSIFPFAQVWGSFLQSGDVSNRTSLQSFFEQVILDGMPASAYQKVLKLFSKGVGLMWAKRLPLFSPYSSEVLYYKLRLQATLLPQIQSDLKHIRPHFVLVTPQVNPLILLNKPKIPATHTRWILSSYDVESERLGRMVNAYTKGYQKVAARWDAWRGTIYEARMLQQVDGLIAVSERDKALFMQQYAIPSERIFVVKNGVDINYFSFEPDWPPGTEPVVLFTGSLTYPPNYMAALRLIQHIMPRVRLHVPNAQLWLVGRNPPAKLRQLASNLDFIKSDVLDIRECYKRAWVACVPLEIGSGTKLKVLEALSVGRILVASPVAIEGLNVQAGKHLLVARSDEEFADAVVNVLQASDVWDEMRYAGRRWVARTYSWEATTSGLTDWMENVYAMPPRRHDVE